MPVLRRPLDHSNVRRPRGTVHVVRDRCKGCKFCVDLCPNDVLTLSTEMNVKGYNYAIVAPGKEAACVNCGFCTLVCPDFAIFSVVKGGPDLAAGSAAL